MHSWLYIKNQNFAGHRIGRLENEFSSNEPRKAAAGRKFKLDGGRSDNRDLPEWAAPRIFSPRSITRWAEVSAQPYTENSVHASSEIDDCTRIAPSVYKRVFYPHFLSLEHNRVFYSPRELCVYNSYSERSGFVCRGGSVL